MRFLDTSIESVFRLRKARENMNWGIIITAFTALVMFAVSMYLYLNLWFITGIYFFIMGFMDIVILVGFVIKREIYSLAIILKEE